MKTSMLAITATACLLGLTGSVLTARAAEDHSGVQSAQAPGSAQAELQTVRKLVGGRWEARLPNNKIIVDTFQSFDSGTYVLGEEWVDGKQITSTVFYIVGSQLWADHFCDYGNQPRYRVKPSADPAVVDLQFRDATDLDTHARHFHSTVWRYIDPTHMTQDWEVMGGPKGRTTVHLDFVRKGATT
jgi:hypothetical protein